MSEENAHPHSPLLNACRSLSRAMDMFDEAAAKILGVGRSDLRALNLLEHGPLGQADLADRMNLARPSITALVDRLSAGGYVERLAVPGDRRANAVGLRSDTWAAFARIYRPLGDHVAQSAADLDEPTRRAVVAAIHTLADAFDTVRTSAEGQAAKTGTHHQRA